MDDRLVRVHTPRRSEVGLLRAAQSARSGGIRQLRSLSTRNQDSAQGAERRIASLRGQLLSAVPSGRALSRADRHVHLPRRISLHRAAGDESGTLRRHGIGARHGDVVRGADSRNDRRGCRLWRRPGCVRAAARHPGPPDAWRAEGGLAPLWDLVAARSRVRACRRHHPHRRLAGVAGYRRAWGDRRHPDVPELLPRERSRARAGAGRRGGSGVTDQPVSESTQLARDRTGLGHPRTDLADERTDLALERTALAHERTLMAWVRTATSMISFGFTIYKFFDYLRSSKQLDMTPHLFGPRAFAMSMIGIGLTALVLATIEHRQSLAALERSGAHLRRSLSQVIAMLVAALGILGLILVIFRQ